MKNLIALITLVITSLPGFAQEEADKIIGLWDADKTNVEIHKTEDAFIGNPIVNGERKEQIELLNLSYEDEKWVGKLYNRKKDKLFDVVCQLQEADLVLNVKAGRFSREVVWTRID